MRLSLRDELPFIAVTLTYRGGTIVVPDVLVDTGAASTVVNADLASEVGIVFEGTDRLRTLRGVGGHEYVFVRAIDRVAVGEFGVAGFEIEVGEMDYGFQIGAILGMDFLRRAGAVIDLHRLRLEFAA